MLSIKKNQTYCSLKFSIIPLGGAMYWSAPGLGVGIPCAGTLGATVVTPGGSVGAGVVTAADGLQPRRLNLMAGAPVYCLG